MIVLAIVSITLLVLFLYYKILGRQKAGVAEIEAFRISYSGTEVDLVFDNVYKGQEVNVTRTLDLDLAQLETGLVSIRYNKRFIWVKSDFGYTIAYVSYFIPIILLFLLLGFLLFLKGWLL